MSAAPAPLTRWSAPGKVVVVGEYAVLDGAPALVAAVDPGVTVRVWPDPVRRATSPTGDTRFVDAALHAADAPPAHYAFADADPDAGASGAGLGGKPGLGGSAAATVAAVAAARHLRGAPLDRAVIGRIAAEVHHAVQGSGSGIDVAASTWGGMLRFVRDAPPRQVPEVPLTVVYSGASAATGPRVARYRAWVGREAFVAASTALVDAFHDDPAGVLREAGARLMAMAEAAGIDYLTPALARLAALADAHGGAAKPSGAGGGDSVVAWLPDPDARAAYVAAAAREGFPTLATHLAAGVRPEPP